MNSLFITKDRLFHGTGLSRFNLEVYGVERAKVFEFQ